MDFCATGLQNSHYNALHHYLNSPQPPGFFHLVFVTALYRYIDCLEPNSTFNNWHHPPIFLILVFWLCCAKWMHNFFHSLYRQQFPPLPFFIWNYCGGLQQTSHSPHSTPFCLLPLCCGLVLHRCPASTTHPHRAKPTPFFKGCFCCGLVPQRCPGPTKSSPESTTPAGL